MAGSRHSGARATGSSAERFHSARLRLTLLYVAIIVAIVGVLSASLYGLHLTDVGRHEREREALLPRADEDAAAYDFDDYVASLGRSIVLADALTIVVAAGLSWLLASRTLRPLREAVEAEQRFYVDAAHELRTPLAVMRSEAEIALRSGTLDPEARRVLESSLEEIARMAARVDTMIAQARDSSRPGPH
jgi:signal transduction histidine kinase